MGPGVATTHMKSYAIRRKAVGTALAAHSLHERCTQPGCSVTFTNNAYNITTHMRARQKQWQPCTPLPRPRRVAITVQSLFSKHMASSHASTSTHPSANHYQPISQPVRP